MNWPLIISNTLFTAISIQAIAYVLAAIGLNMHFGFTGLLNFGQAAFGAVGAYTFAVLAGQGIPWPASGEPPWPFGQPWPWWAAALAVIPAAMVLALLLGIPTLRLRADYLAIVTIAAAEIIRQALIAPKLDERFGTGGADGLQGFTGGIEKINPWNGRTFYLWKQPFDGHQAFMIVAGWSLAKWDYAIPVFQALIAGACVMRVFSLRWQWISPTRARRAPPPEPSALGD